MNCETQQMLWFALWLLVPLIPSILIFVALPKSEGGVDGPLQGLTIKFSGGAAMYAFVVILGGYLFIKDKIHNCSEPTEDKVWHIHGKAINENGEKVTDNVSLCFVPDYKLKNGYIEFDIVSDKKDGKIIFPKLSLQSPGKYLPKELDEIYFKQDFSDTAGKPWKIDGRTIELGNQVLQLDLKPKNIREKDTVIASVKEFEIK